MAIAYASAGTRLVQGTASGSWSIPFPATVNAGDLLVLHVVSNGGSVTNPSGWTTIHNEATVSNPEGGVWITVAAGTEGGTNLSLTISSTTGNAQMFRYTGVDTSTPLDGTPTVVSSAATATAISPASITTSTTNTMLVYACGANSGSTTVSSGTGTERVDHGALGGTGARSGALYDQANASSGATGTRTMTLSAARAHWACMFALREAGGGGTPGNVTAVTATGTAAAVAPAVEGLTNVTSPAGTVTVSAPAPVTANNYGVVVATGTAAAVVPTVAGGVGVAAVAAQASAAAVAPTLQVPHTATAPAATGTVAAVAPTVQWGQTVTGVTATVSVAAPVPTTANNYGAVVATISVAALPLEPKAGWTVVAVRAQASAAAVAPSVSVFVGVAAPTATVSVAAPAPAVSYGANTTAVAATASAAALPPAVAAVAGVAAITATVTVAAPAPTVFGGVVGNVTAVRAQASAAAVAPTVAYGSTVTAVRAQGSSLALPPTLGVSPTITAVRAQGSAEAIPPTVTTFIIITAPTATVAVTGHAPTVSALSGVPAEPATVTVSAKAPTVIGRRVANVTAVRATGTSRGWAPKFTGGVVIVAPRKNVSVAARIVIAAPGAKFIGRTMTSSLTLTGTPGPSSFLSINTSRTLSGNPEGTVPNVQGPLSLSHTHELPLAATAIGVTSPLLLNRPMGKPDFLGQPSIIGTPGLTRSLMGNLGLDGVASIPGQMVYRRCEKHTAYIYDRGGRRQIGALGKLALVRWERKRDDISSATVVVQSPDRQCVDMLELVEAARMELVIYRGNVRVWEGPITRAAFRGDRAEIFASDVMWYVHRTIMMGEYDNRHPNTSTVIDRVQRVMNAEVSRLEAQDPSINVLNHVEYVHAVAPAQDARTAARTVPYEMTVFEHVDTYAARGGLDYTVAGRTIYFFDVHHKLGQTPMVTRDDFIGDPIITQYGSEVATYVAMTDGKGNWGEAGGDDPYYGRLEVLHQAYDENAGPAESNQPPTVAEMTSQARRAYGSSKVPPTVVRVPDGTRLNPNGALDITFLIPGVHIPLNAKLPGRSITQMQKLDNMTVEETPESGEIIQVTLSPATSEVFVEE